LEIYEIDRTLDEDPAGAGVAVDMAAIAIEVASYVRWLGWVVWLVVVQHFVAWLLQLVGWSAVGCCNADTIFCGTPVAS